MENVIDLEFVEGLNWGILFTLHMDNIFRTTVMGYSLLCEFAY